MFISGNGKSEEETSAFGEIVLKIKRPTAAGRVKVVGHGKRIRRSYLECKPKEILTRGGEGDVA